MSELLTSFELARVLERHIPSCDKLIIISAYVTKPAVRWLTNLTAQSSPDITIVGRFSPNDFILGASDIESLKGCINSGITIKALPNLHAKIYQIDTNKIFTGSANLTGKGLGLISEYNIESASELEATESNLKFIKNVVDNATQLDTALIEKMEVFINELLQCTTQTGPNTWPEGFMELSTQIFVTDFPLNSVNEPSLEYKLNPSLPFAILEQELLSENEKAALFKKTKVYKWLIATLKANREGIRFGELTHLIHKELADDPRPYRRDVKSLQSNLYRYIKCYASDEIEVYVPGQRSEYLKLKT